MKANRRQLIQTLSLAALPGVAAPELAEPSGGDSLRFPRDFGAHPAQRLEWWYLTGVLAEQAQAPPRFGYQLTFFRLRGPAAQDHPSRFAARQLLLAHAAVSDLKASRLLHDQRLARAGFGLAEASDADCDLRLRDGFLRRYAASYGADYRAGFVSNSAGFEFELALQTTQPVLLQGRDGLSRKGPDPTQFSHYYSQVQLQTQARLSLAGKAYRLTGRSWLDHEWSDNLLGAKHSAEQAIGWDWTGINLDDGSALTLFRLRRADGSQRWAGGSWRRPGGASLDFKPEQIGMRPLRLWRSPHSAASYPLEWEVTSPLGKHRLRALLDDQEVDARASTGMHYWEGVAELQSLEGSRLGLGYLEMTGYAGAMKLLQSSD